MLSLAVSQFMKIRGLDTLNLFKVYSISNSESKARTINQENTFTKNTEYSSSYIVSEENSYTIMNNEDRTDEKNWSESIEESHIEEVSRISLDDFNKARKFIYKANILEVKYGNIDEPSKFEKSMSGIYNNFVYPILDYVNSEDTLRFINEIIEQLMILL